MQQPGQLDVRARVSSSVLRRGRRIHPAHTPPSLGALPEEVHVITLEVWVTKGGDPAPGAEVQVEFGRPPKRYAEGLPNTGVDGFTAKTLATASPPDDTTVWVRHEGNTAQFRPPHR